MAINVSNLQKYLGKNRDLDKMDLQFMSEIGRPLEESERAYAARYADGYSRILADARKRPQNGQELVDKEFPGLDLKIMGRYFEAGNSMADMEKAAKKGDAMAAKYIAALPIISKWQESQAQIKQYAKDALRSGIEKVSVNDFVNKKNPTASNTSPTKDSEIARAKQVWADADKLAGTGKYVGKTADQIRTDAHAYAESLRAGGPILSESSGQSADQGVVYPSGSQVGKRILEQPSTSDFPVVTVEGVTYNKDSSGKYVPVNGVFPATPEQGAPATAPVDPVANTAGYEAALKQMESDPNFKNLPPSIQSLFRDTLKSYDFNKELNVANVLSEFNRIKTETIDPRFSQEVDKFTNDLNQEYTTLATQRDMEKEALAANAGQDIRQARAGLEKAGMTFTGQGIEQLGAGSAYAQPGANVATPVQTSFGGLFNEGTVNQSNRLMASSAQSRYRSQLNALGSKAENVLGGKGVAGIIPGYVPSGTLPGSIEDTKQSQYGQTLSQLMGQNYQNLNNNQNLKYNL